MNETVKIYKQLLRNRFPSVVVSDSFSSYEGVDGLDIYYVEKNIIGAIYDYMLSEEKLPSVPVCLHTIEDTIKYYSEILPNEFSLQSMLSYSDINPTNMKLGLPEKTIDNSYSFNLTHQYMPSSKTVDYKPISEISNQISTTLDTHNNNPSFDFKPSDIFQKVA